MRMWNTDVTKMCNKHLLGEHLEMHMFLGCLKKGTSITGYIDKGLVEVHNIPKRHEELVVEMKKRGMNHNSDVPLCLELEEVGCVNVEENEIELMRRCGECRKIRESMMVVSK